MSDRDDDRYGLSLGATARRLGVSCARVRRWWNRRLRARHARYVVERDAFDRDSRRFS